MVVLLYWGSSARWFGRRRVRCCWGSSCHWSAGCRKEPAIVGGGGGVLSAVCVRRAVGAVVIFRERTLSIGGGGENLC